MTVTLCEAVRKVYVAKASIATKAYLGLLTLYGAAAAKEITAAA
jgi:hypothetical protein